MNILEKMRKDIEINKNRIAISSNNESMTYEELITKSDRLACYLKEQFKDN